MSRYATLKSRVPATAVFWVEISGMPWAVGDGNITEASKASFFNDGYTEDLTFINALEPPTGTFSRSIEIVPGSGTVGGFSVSFSDVATSAHPDGYFTWMFGGDRSTIGVATLNEDIEIDETDWLLSATQNTMPGYIAPDIGTAYAGLETVFYRNESAEGSPVLTHWNAVQRSAYLSPSIPHRANQWGNYPTVTDHPTEWAGRIVTLFQTYMDGNGLLASSDGTTATTREEAHKWRGVLRDITFRDGVWTIRCDSLDTLLKRKACRGAVQLQVTPRVYVPATMINQDIAADGLVAGVGLYDPTNDVWYNFSIQIAVGYYSRDTFLAAFNAEFDAATLTDTDGNLTWLGALSAAFVGEELRFTYTTSAVAADIRICWINLVYDIYNVDENRPGNTSEYWIGIGALNVAEGNLGSIFMLPPNDDSPVASTPYSVAIQGSAHAEVPFHIAVSNFRVACAANEAGDTVADFAAGDAVAIVSGEGVSACKVLDSDPADSSLLLAPLTDVRQAEQILHAGTFDQPITIRHAFYAVGNEIVGLGDSTLELLLSTGLSGFNHANYDTQAEGVGLSIPYTTPMAGASNSGRLLSVDSFREFFTEAEAFNLRIVDFLYEPTVGMEWVKQRLGFLGGFLSVRDGEICAVRPEALLSRTDATLTEEEIQDGGSISTGQVHTVDHVIYEYDWSLVNEKYASVTDAVRGNATADEQTNEIKFSDKGIIIPDPLRVRWLAGDILYAFCRENWIYELTSDRVHWDLEPGDVIRFSDSGVDDTTDDARRYQGLPNPDGTRGHSRVRLMVLSVSTDLTAGTTQIKAVNLRTRHTGYSPSAWVESWATAGGKTTLTCTAQFFSPTADGKDVARFAVGDKVRLLSVNPTQAGADPGVETGEAGLTIESINSTASTITLTGAVALAWPAPPAAASQCMVLVHDDYETASQTTDAQEWAWAGDSSGDIDDGGDKCYHW